MQAFREAAHVYASAPLPEMLHLSTASANATVSHACTTLQAEGKAFVGLCQNRSALSRCLVSRDAMVSKLLGANSSGQLAILNALHEAMRVCLKKCIAHYGRAEDHQC